MNVNVWKYLYGNNLVSNYFENNKNYSNLCETELWNTNDCKHFA